MNLLILILSLIVLMSNVVVTNFVPSIAIYPGQPFLYYSEQGWVKFEELPNVIKDVNETVKFCQIAYRDKNITNAIQMYKLLDIKKWCNESKPCSTYDEKAIKQFRCINSSYKNEKMAASSNCKMRINVELECVSYDRLKEKARDLCKEESMVLSDFQPIYKQFSCVNAPMRFDEGQLVCCPDKSKPKPDPNGFSTNNMTYTEKVFMKRKIMLETNAKVLRTLEKNLQFQLNKILTENSNKIISDKLFDNLNQIFKRRFVNIMEKFSETFFEKEKSDIEKIINRSEVHCENNAMETCETQLNSLIENLRKYYDQICSNYNVEIMGCKSFIVKQLVKLKDKYAKENTSMSENFEFTISYLRSKPTPKSYEDLFQMFFRKNKNKAIQNLDQTSHAHGAPIMSIVVTILILFILLVLTCLVTLVMKYCDQPFRRGSPNYVMSVVFNTNQTPSATQKSSQPSTNIPNKQHSVKLNLYENPIFNAKSASKPSEKQSLIENMES